MATEQEGHTAGPWVAEGADVFGDHNIILRDGEDRRAVAAVVSNMRDPSEVAANARLIAAAPDLLKDGAFLADRLDELENDLLDDEAARQFYGHVAPALARFRAAIARATGEA